MNRVSVIFGAVSLALVAATLTLASDWWKAPFGKSDESERKSETSRSKPSAFAPVHFDGEDDSKSSRRSQRSSSSASRSYNNEPESASTWQKVKGGTGRFFAKSKHTLMPWTKPKAAPAASATGVRRVYYPTQKPKKEEKGLFSWLGDEEKDEKPQTVVDWLDQPRPY